MRFKYVEIEELDPGNGNLIVDGSNVWAIELSDHEWDAYSLIYLEDTLYSFNGTPIPPPTYNPPDTPWRIVIREG